MKYEKIADILRIIAEKLVTQPILKISFRIKIYIII